MSTLLERALAEVSKLPEVEQEALAAWILDELAHDRRWQAAFDRSHDIVARLADEALTEHRAGLTRPLDSDES